MWSIVEVLEKHLVVTSGIFQYFLFQFAVELHALLSVTIPSNGLTKFEKFWIDDLLLNTPNRHQHLQTMEIQLFCRCECLVGIATWFSAHLISIKYSHPKWQYDANTFLLCHWNSNSHVEKTLSDGTGLWSPYKVKLVQNLFNTSINNRCCFIAYKKKNKHFTLSSWKNKAYFVKANALGNGYFMNHW